MNEHWSSIHDGYSLRIICPDSNVCVRMGQTKVVVIYQLGLQTNIYLIVTLLIHTRGCHPYSVGSVGSWVRLHSATTATA